MLAYRHSQALASSTSIHPLHHLLTPPITQCLLFYDSRDLVQQSLVSLAERRDEPRRRLFLEDSALVQAVTFVVELDRGALGGTEISTKLYNSIRDSTYLVVNSILYVRRLIAQKQQISNEPANSGPCLLHHSTSIEVTLALFIGLLS